MPNIWSSIWRPAVRNAESALHTAGTSSRSGASPHHYSQLDARVAFMGRGGYNCPGQSGTWMEQPSQRPPRFGMNRPLPPRGEPCPFNQFLRMSSGSRQRNKPLPSARGWPQQLEESLRHAVAFPQWVIEVCHNCGILHVHDSAHQLSALIAKWNAIPNFGST